MPRPFAVIGITFFITLLILSYLDESAAIIALCMASVCFIPMVCIRSIREQAVIPAAILAVAAGCIMFLVNNEYKYKPVIALAGEKINITGVIVNLPAKENGRFYYIIKTDTMNKKPVKVKIRLSCAEQLTAKPYDTIKTETTVYVLGERSEDSLQYYKTTGVYLGAYSFSDIAVGSTQNKPIMYYVLSLKQALLNNVNNILPNENGGLIDALLFGNKSYLSENTLENFRDIGISHIIAISGLNLSIFLLIFLDIFERLKLNKRIVYALSLFFVVTIMALAGFSASVLRAGIMLIVLLLGKLINKEADALNSIGFSVLLISAFNPLGAGYVGLQLSFFATLGILVMQKRIAKPFDKIADRLTATASRRIIKFITETVSVTVASFIFTLPTIFITFKKVALISIISNMMLVYSSTISMIFGGISALTMQFKAMEFISNPAAIIAGLLAKYIIKCSALLAKIPFANLSVNEVYIQLWLGGALLLLAAAVLIYKKDGKIYFKLSAILCAASLFVGITSHSIISRKVTKIIVTEVGNASAVIVSKQGKAVMVGCGGDDLEVSNIYNALDENNLKSIDLMLIPRAEKTESQAVTDIIERYDVKKIVAPELNYDLEIFSFKDNLKISKNESVTLWEGASLDYIYNEDLSCAYANFEGTTALFIFYPGCSVNKIPKGWKNADILICRSQPPESLNCLEFRTVIISADENIKIPQSKLFTSTGENTFATAFNGSIVIKSAGNSVFSVRGDK